MIRKSENCVYKRFRNLYVLAFDWIDIETWGWFQNVPVVSTHQLICKMTYFGHIVTLTIGHILKFTFRIQLIYFSPAGAGKFESASRARVKQGQVISAVILASKQGTVSMMELNSLEWHCLFVYIIIIISGAVHHTTIFQNHFNKNGSLLTPTDWCLIKHTLATTATSFCSSVCSHRTSGLSVHVQCTNMHVCTHVCLFWIGRPAGRLAGSRR